MNDATENSWVTLKVSPIHGRGLFAVRDIPAQTQIIEYVGEKITKAESLVRCEANNFFIFALDDAYDLDGSVEWNLARWINHSCEPNCDAEIIDDHIWITSREPIPAGKEITFNYGYDLDEYRDYPCRCGSPACLGYIVAEEFHEQLRRQREHGGSLGSVAVRAKPDGCS